ncbi:uncharacterized protein TNCV_4957811 [Trichonephila clavipes]|nr:uncharacterized protein TNCV_4957811 [Trichonephila clavipes]
MKTADAKAKKGKQSGIVCTCNLQQFEIVCYESFDILQAPRLVNNPFAYAYTNNPFCGKDFPPLDPEKHFHKHFSHLQALNNHRDQNKRNN